MRDVHRVNLIVEAIEEISAALKKIRRATKGAEKEYIEVLHYYVDSYKLGMDFLAKFRGKVQKLITKSEFEDIIKTLRKEFPDDIDN